MKCCIGPISCAKFGMNCDAVSISALFSSFVLILYYPGVFS
jgi:hypothetical protein